MLREQVRLRNPGWQPATERFAALVRAEMRPATRLLDLGCGRGGLVEQLDHPLNQMIGVDPDWQSLREHRLMLPRVAALGALPFASASLDLVYASWVLEHWADPARDLREIARVLRPGGAFVFITPNRRHPLVALNRLIGAAGRLQTALVTALYGRAATDTFGVHYRANSRRRLGALAQTAGLTLERLEPISDPTYLAFNALLFHLSLTLERRLPSENHVHLVGAMRRAHGTIAEWRDDTPDTERKDRTA